MRKKFTAFLLTLCLIFAVIQAPNPTSFAAADNTERLSDAVAAASEYLLRLVPNPTVSSVGGEWTVFALARSKTLPLNYGEKYCENLKKTLSERSGVLSERKYTEYSRAILALTALGKDPRSAAGYNLLLPLGDFEGTVRQGINGAIWALIALDSGKYDISASNAAAIRERYIEYILTRQLADGGFSFDSASEASDVDITAMALAALSEYTDSEKVAAAVDAAVKFLSESQNDSGGYESWGAENSESAAQVLIGITSVGISPNDARFTKNNKTLIDNLLSFQTSDGGFEHERGAGAEIMPAEQALCGLTAALYFENTEGGIFDIRSENNKTKNLDPSELIWYIRMRGIAKDGYNVFLYSCVSERSGKN